MSKLYSARSLLYRRQILQVNIRWKALDEIYKIYMLLHRSDLNISENFRQKFRIFWQILQNSLFLNSFHLFLLRLLPHLAVGDAERDHRLGELQDRVNLRHPGERGLRGGRVRHFLDEL